MAKSKKYEKPPLYVIGEGGTTFVDLFVNASEAELLICQPGMSVVELISVSDIEHNEADPDLLTGYSKLARELVVTSYCGHTGLDHLVPAIRNQRLAPQLVIDVGAVGMYQNQVTIKTRSGEALAKLIRRSLMGNGRRGITFGLMPVLQMSSHHSPMTQRHSGHIQPAVT